MFELKALTSFKGHEGEPLLQSNIYKNGKKVGAWSDDSHGGCMRIYFDSKDIEVEFDAWAEAFMAKHNIEKCQYSSCAELVISAIANNLYLVKAMKAKARKAIVLLDADFNKNTSHGYHFVNVEPCQKNIDAVKKQNPQMLVFNENPNGYQY